MNEASRAVVGIGGGPIVIPPPPGAGGGPGPNTVVLDSININFLFGATAGTVVFALTAGGKPVSTGAQFRIYGAANESIKQNIEWPEGLSWPEGSSSPEITLNGPGDAVAGSYLLTYHYSNGAS